YHSTLAFTLTFGKTTGIKLVGEFFDDAAAGELPAVSYIDPAFSFEPNVGNDDHPPADIRDGQAFIASVYNALANSPHWERCLLIITYDEHGGFYDHVAPPNDAVDELPEFQQLGFRVPSLVVGPHVRKGCVSATRLDHVSLLSTITRKFGLTPLNDRVMQTNDVAMAIDPAFIDDPQPPIALPTLRRSRPARYRSDVAFGGQTELARFMDRPDVPAHLDRRGDHEATMHALFDRAVSLGAVEEEP
ncbi:MAG: alkaline phosphatase family protein, partial [Myxococcota bacterium]